MAVFAVEGAGFGFGIGSMFAVGPASPLPYAGVPI